MAMERSVVVAVDLDHALADVLPAAVEWHNAQKKTTITVADLKSPDWVAQLAGGSDHVAQWLQDFHQSTPFKSNVVAVEGAVAALRPLRSYFTLFAVTDRPRSIEKETHEWIDLHFAGIFDKVLFVDGDHTSKDNDVVARKKALFGEFRVKIAVGADSVAVGKVADAVDHAVHVGSVPWGKPSECEKAVKAENWDKARDALEQVAKELKLPMVAKVSNGPKLARYSDDLVTISMKNPAVFYANLVHTKFAVQKQKSVRLQASEGGITTAVQVAELLKTQQNARIAKISTRYMSRKSRGTPSHRVPAIEIVVNGITA